KRLVHALEGVAIELHLGKKCAEVSEVGDQPGIADPRRPLHRRIHHAADPDRRAARPNRPQADTEIVDLEYLAVIGDTVFWPEPPHDLDAFGQALCAFRERNIEGIELVFAIADAD